MNTPTFTVDLDWSSLEPDGDFNSDGTPAHTRLSGHVLLGGHYFHLEAIEVKMIRGCMAAVNSSLQDDVDHLFELNGDHGKTVDIAGRTYLVYLIPFAQ